MHPNFLKAAGSSALASTIAVLHSVFLQTALRRVGMHPKLVKPGGTGCLGTSKSDPNGFRQIGSSGIYASLELKGPPMASKPVPAGGLGGALDDPKPCGGSGRTSTPSL